MKNFKEIAEKCLAGELKGIFKNRKGEYIPSEVLFRSADKTYPYIYCDSRCVTVYGNYYNSGRSSDYDIIDFIPDKIEIDIPENKVPVMEQTESGIVITWKEKELTYRDIVDRQTKTKTHIGIFSYNMLATNLDVHSFYKKVEVLRKLTNIRNYFGKPDSYDRGYCIEYTIYNNTFRVGCINTIGDRIDDVLFKEKEHAEQAIKMLGDELKYLFEPW